MGYMFQTLKTIVSDNWEWRVKILKLAQFEIKKKSRGAVLSWAWFFIRPVIYIFCFWFALEVGMRGGNYGSSTNVPYIIWLAAGIIPWFYMQEMINAGSNVLHKFPYLVTKIKFPISAISSIFCLGEMLIQLMLQVGLLLLYLANGLTLDIYMLQVPIALFLMLVFWNMFSIMCSQITAFSKDAANLIKALSTPFFWLSGIIFNVKNIPIDAVQVILQYNPVTFFAVVMRDALCDKVWFWDDPNLCFGFAVVFIVTLLCMLFVYKRMNEEVADVL